MQAFEITRNLESKAVEAERLKELIADDKVLVVTDDSNRQIFLIAGKRSTPVDYLIARRIIREIRKYFRGFYSFEVVRDPEKLGPILEQPIIKEGEVPEVYNPNVHDEEENKRVLGEDPQSTGSVIVLDNSSEWHDLDGIDSLDIFGEKTFAELRRYLEGSGCLSESDEGSIEYDSQTEPSDAELDGDALIPGEKSAPEIGLKYSIFPEMIFVSNGVYQRIPEIDDFIDSKNFTLKKRVKKKFRKLGNLPEGFFFPNSSDIYGTEFCVKNGKIAYISLLRKVKVSEFNTNPENREKELTKGVILAPVIIQKELLPIYNIDEIKKGFNISEPPDVDDLVKRIKEYGQEDN